MHENAEKIARETHQLFTKMDEHKRRWLVCARCRVAWLAGWGIDYLTPCEASAWGR